MIIGEVCLQTNGVPRLANFYKRLLEVENDCQDETHQFILTEGTALTVYNDGTRKNDQNRNISLAFTVEDVEREYEKVLALGAKIDHRGTHQTAMGRREHELLRPRQQRDLP